MLLYLKIKLLKCTASNLGHKVYFKGHAMFFSEEDLLLFPTIFYLLMCAWWEREVKGEVSWRKTDNRERLFKK